jgi:hypothetical protein
MNIQASAEDIEFVKEAERLKDWHVLTSWKQRFIYQRYVALPRNDIFTVKEIAKAAHDKLYGESGHNEIKTNISTQEPMDLDSYETAKKIF